MSHLAIKTIVNLKVGVNICYTGKLLHTLFLCMFVFRLIHTPNGVPKSVKRLETYFN